MENKKNIVEPSFLPTEYFGGARDLIGGVSWERS
jgi:hypothetical protein